MKDLEFIRGERARHIPVSIRYSANSSKTSEKMDVNSSSANLNRESGARLGATGAGSRGSREKLVRIRINIHLIRILGGDIFIMWRPTER